MKAIDSFQLQAKDSLPKQYILHRPSSSSSSSLCTYQSTENIVSESKTFFPSLLCLNLPLVNPSLNTQDVGSTQRLLSKNSLKQKLGKPCTPSDCLTKDNEEKHLVAQKRVLERKKSERERKALEELEKREKEQIQLKRQENEKQEKKQRRAQIYAINAFMRENFYKMQLSSSQQANAERQVYSI